jgi:hypothetical protein
MKQKRKPDEMKGKLTDRRQKADPKAWKRNLFEVVTSGNDVSLQN